MRAPWSLLRAPEILSTLPPSRQVNSVRPHLQNLPDNKSGKAPLPLPLAPPPMCWKCDAIAPQCRAVTPEAWENLCLACPDQTSYDSDDLAADFPEIITRTRNMGTQTGSLLWPEEREQGRARTLARPVSPGMTAPRQKSDPDSVLSHPLTPNSHAQYCGWRRS